MAFFIRPFARVKKQLYICTQSQMYAFMKRVLFLFMAVLTVLPIVLRAAEPVRMIVWQTDGNKTVLPLSDKPTLTCSDTLVVIKTDSVEVRYPLKRLRKFTFEEMPSSVMAMQILPAERAVFDINGRRVDGSYSTLDDLPSGIYIIREGSVTYKVLRQ